MPGAAGRHARKNTHGATYSVYRYSQNRGLRVIMFVLPWRINWTTENGPQTSSGGGPAISFFSKEDRFLLRCRQRVNVDFIKIRTLFQSFSTQIKFRESIGHAPLRLEEHRGWRVP